MPSTFGSPDTSNAMIQAFMMDASYCIYVALMSVVAFVLH